MNDNKKKYSVVKSFMKPFWIIFDNFKTLLLQGACFSTIIVLLSYLTGQKYLCFFNQEVAQSMYCPNNHLYFPYLILKLLVISVFINLWYDKVFKNIVINQNQIKICLKNSWKTLALMLVFIGINILPAISSMLLLLRVPNPVWQIEQLYFTMVAIGFLAPFFLIRFYGLFAQFLADKNWKQFKILWNNTSGFTMKIVLSCALLFLIGLMILAVAVGFFRGPTVLLAEIYNILAEFAFAFASYFVIVMLINFFEVERKEFLV